MPRPRKSVPTYSHHVPSGQAYVRVPDGKGGRRIIYLGEFNTPESRGEYARIVAELATAPDTRAATGGPAGAVNLTVSEVLVRFWDHAQQHYRREDGTTTNEVVEYLRDTCSFRDFLSIR